jgi:hypothetical protein
VGGRVLLDTKDPPGLIGPNETLAVHVSREKLHSVSSDAEGVNVLVDSCVTNKAKSKSYKLESLILAQNERWRQA